jgi:hypothetical protein
MAGIADILAQAALGGGGTGLTSADPFGLNAFQTQIGGDDIYRTIGAQLLDSSKLFANPLSMAQGIDYGSGKLNPVVSYHPAESAIGGFLTSLLGGLSTEYGKADEAKQMTSVASILPSLLAHPELATTPAGVDEEAFSKLKANAEVNSAIRAQKMNDTLQEFAAEQKLRDPLSYLIAQHIGLTGGGDSGANTTASPGGLTEDELVKDALNKKLGIKTPTGNRRR